ncbi:synaptonemal complex protein 1 isoform X3 [Myripristis murdjan]|uniref:synaptonemal complex protein 1 isoform X3 n=1 Tax=Myripristis murdjan TaxID=586833 RepID=UPI00117618D3|nr:synaptonemal complex protein 1 isoform X3 [Myripristis murdjan]
MDRDKGFNFKLLVPPRVNSGHVFAVRPQEIIEDCGASMLTKQQGYSKCFNKENSIPFSNTNMVMPTKPTRQDVPKMKVVPPMEKEGLYSNLLDEVDKIKSWKVKVDSETVQRERKLQENKKTIETQRKAIQELQFGNESLSIKLEEQISENEDLRNKNSATRNLCNILKDTFERSAEKMQLFESDREETHQFLLENSESIQKMIAAFESLRIQTEADKREMQKVKEDMLEFENLSKKFDQEYGAKQGEVVMLQTELKGKEAELQKVLLNLHESQENCKQLQETANQQYELLKSSKNEQDSLLQKLQTAEQLCKEMETSREVIAAALEQSKEEYEEIILQKDNSLQELNRVKDQQADKLEQIQTAIQELQKSLTFEMQRAKTLEVEVMAINKELERTTALLGEATEQSTKKDEEIKTIVADLDIKSKSIESLMEKIQVTEVTVEELTAELSRTTEHAQLLKVKMQEMEEQICNEMKKNQAHIFQVEQLKNDIMQHEVKYEDLLSSFSELESEKKAMQEQIESGSAEAKALETKLEKSEEKGTKVSQDIQRLEEENRCLREDVNTLNNKIQDKYQETGILQKKIEESHKHWQNQITKKEKKIKEAEAKINSLKEESHNLKRHSEETQQNLLEDLRSKSIFAEELQNEVNKLKCTVAEVTKNKEDAELKCQHKIADMVALMEKHKSQYDRMVEEKDAELDEIKKKEMEAVASRMAMEMELSQNKKENDCLKKEITEKKNLQKELNDLKKDMSSKKNSQQSEAKDKQVQNISPVSNSNDIRCSETPKQPSAKRHVFDFTKTRRTLYSSRDYVSTAATKLNETGMNSVKELSGATPKTKGIQNEDLRTHRSSTNWTGATPKIKSYRIRTPPSVEKSAPWRKGIIDPDSKSDSSEQNELLTFVDAPEPSVLASNSKLNIFSKSPAIHKSPGSSLKLAAIKRMRDAGWTAVTGCDKKKKTTEKIFA